jgi:hypothetical protein
VLPDREIVEAFLDLTEPAPGHSHSAVLPDGTCLEGGLVPGDDGVEFWIGGPLGAGESLVLPWSDLDLAEFYLARSGTRMLTRMRWSAPDGRWERAGGDPVALADLGPHPSVRLVQWRAG